jgi:mRNA interferase RelE/StbE
VNNQPAWRIAASPAAESDLKHLPAQEQARLRAAIDGLSSGLYHANVRKLRGRENEWRLRVGSWRIRFRPDPDKRLIWILRVLPRAGAYRD